MTGRSAPTQRIVIATERTSLADGGDRLLRLARWMQRLGVEVEVLALAEGDDAAAFRAVAPTTVLRQLLGPAQSAASVVGGSRVAQGLRGRALRRWVDSRSDAGFVVHHPLAASVLRYSANLLPTVAMFPASSWSSEDLRPADRDTLATAAGWLVCDAAQVADVEAAFGVEAIEQGSLLDIDDLPPIAHAARGAIVLLPTADTWESVNHTVEVALALRDAAPDHEICWIVDGEHDHWLAEHDCRHSGITDAIRVVPGDGDGVPSALAAVVRTGYGPSPSPLVLAARVAGVPVLGFAEADVSPPLAPVGTFDVEALVAETLAVLGPGGVEAAGIRPFAGIAPRPTDVVAQVLDWLALTSADVT